MLSLSSGFKICNLSSSSGFRNCSLSLSSGFRICNLSSSSGFRNCSLSLSSGFKICSLSSSSGFGICSLSLMSGCRICSLILTSGFRFRTCILHKRLREAIKKHRPASKQVLSMFELLNGCTFCTKLWAFSPLPPLSHKIRPMKVKCYWLPVWAIIQTLQSFHF